LGDYGTGIGGNDRQSYYYAETENIRHFKYRVMGEWSVRMLSEWVVVTRQWPRNLAIAHQIAPQARITSFAVDYTFSEPGEIAHFIYPFPNSLLPISLPFEVSYSGLMTASLKNA